MQGIKVNVLDGGLMPSSIRAVLSSASLGLADAHPIGSTVSSALKTVALHKALQQINGMTIFSLPITSDAMSNPAQNIAGQVRHAHPGNDQKARVVGDKMEVSRPPRALPTEVVVSGGTLPSGGAKEHTGQRMVLGIPDQILKIFPYGTAVAQIMMLVQ